MQIIKEHDICRVYNGAIKVSIIYNYYSKESTLFHSLESLQNQSLDLCYRDEIEIIIIDDGSEGENISKRLLNNIIYIWQRKFDYGISRAKNTGAKLANGQYLIFLDPDIIVCNTFINEVLKGFNKYGDRIIQCGYIWDYFSKGSPDPRIEFGIWLWEDSDHLSDRFYQVAGGNMAISKTLFEETKGFDEDLIYGGVEDLLFGHNVSTLKGTAICFNKKMESWHIPHPRCKYRWNNPGKSWDIVRRKYPDFYDRYCIKGIR